MSGGSHFGCLGFDASDQESLRATLEALWSRTRGVPRTDGGRMLLWEDASGARLVTNTDANGHVLCATPGFAGYTSVRARVRSIHSRECPFCDVVLVEVLERNEVVYPMALQVDDLGTMRAAYAPQSVQNLNVTAFLEGDLERRGSADVRGACESNELRLATEALIPSGTFSLAGAPNVVTRAEVILSGRVVRSELRTNSVTGNPFQHAVVKTLAATIDMVATQAAVSGRLAKGEIISGSFWVVAHLARRRRWWR